MLELLHRRVVNIYVECSGADPAVIEDYMRREKWLSADEYVATKLADGLYAHQLKSAL